MPTYVRSAKAGCEACGEQMEITNIHIAYRKKLEKMIIRGHRDCHPCDPATFENHILFWIEIDALGNLPITREESLVEENRINSLLKEIFSR